MRVTRLKRRAQFLACAASGRKAALPGIVVQARSHDAPGPARLGFTVTKKVGNAVTRNRVKRRLREVARLALSDGALYGHDLVLIGRDGSIGRDFARLREDFDRALTRLGARPSADP